MNYSPKIIFVIIIVTWIVLLCESSDFTEIHKTNVETHEKKQKKTLGRNYKSISNIENGYNYYKIGSTIQNILNPIIINWTK